jgi:hypothetical protein
MLWLEGHCPECILNCLRSILRALNSQSKKKIEKGRLDHLEEEEFQFTPSSKFSHNEERQTNLVEMSKGK